MSSNMKKGLSLITSLAVAFVMCLGCMGAYTSKVFADDPEPLGDPDLIVSYEDEVTTPFWFDEEAYQYFTTEGAERVYIDNIEVPFYSAIKNTGCADNVENACGPLLEDIFTVAGIDCSAMGGQKITFLGNDDYDTSVLWTDIFCDRYAFPNANRPGDPGDYGAAVEDEEFDNMTEVPVIINLDAYKDGEWAPQVSFGQLTPSERNKPNWASKMVYVEGALVIPEIIIEDEEPETCLNKTDENLNHNDGDTIALGDEINFGGTNSKSPYDGYIYYTTDGSTPDQSSEIYNWDTYKKETGFNYNPITADKTGDLVVKTVEYKLGWAKSPVKTFHFTVEGVNLTENGTLTLSGDKFAVGTKPEATVSVGDFVLKPSEYRLSFSGADKVGEAKVTAIGKGENYGKVSATYTVIPAKAALSKVTPGKKKITVSIKSQKDTGVTGYQIAYKLSSASKWKTVTSKSEKKVIKSLKKGKKYNVKVRANGPTGYGAYSAVKTVKVK